MPCLVAVQELQGCVGSPVTPKGLHGCRVLAACASRMWGVLGSGSLLLGKVLSCDEQHKPPRSQGHRGGW